ncbi:MAG: ABC transporter permease subunit, partial [Actinomycetota bacterium]|nr:ABC transporter permease subunit [Actinomycetota bacterium]
GFMIGGSIVVESFFRIPGIGLAIIEAVLRDDFPVVLAIVMLVSCGFMVLNYLADILYSVLDPRIRNTEQGQQKKVTIL